MSFALQDPIDRDEARDLLVRELAKPEYNQRENPLVRFARWLSEQLDNLLNVLPGSGSLSAVLIIAVILIVISAVVFASRQRLRDRALSIKAARSVLGEENLSAKEFRARANRSAASGDWDAALLDYYRALTAGAGERTLLDDAPTRTAHEVAGALATTFPDHGAELGWSADAFDRVRYGQQSCTQAEAERVRDLDTTVQKARPVAAWSTV
ncbi:MAG: DUF4129 domain-containing protein [Ornithinimicrobium sp.]